MSDAQTIMHRMQSVEAKAKHANAVAKARGLLRDPQYAQILEEAEQLGKCAELFATTAFNASYHLDARLAYPARLAELKGQLDSVDSLLGRFMTEHDNN